MANRLLLGFDVGSSSVKASLVNADNSWMGRAGSPDVVE